ncbi:unnamed protein product [Heligmosomoides polygyrus]|uniref:ULP_PROTEASE domain-containing protein n=1 Tax=Heligmosomoides polygyrus TaxID=6339 RepID=A0A183GK92_HELPZ|nr:unnamed protein product [Heligmosomoides polygyrus]
MTGVLASLVFNHFLPEYKGLRDKRINFCDPEALTNILAACEKTPVTTLTRETVAWFANRKGETPTYLKALLHSKLSMIPVCYSGHWVLGMLQLKRREEDIRARMIVVDSLFHSTSFKNLTQLVAEMAYSAFGVALKAALYLTNSKYDLGKYTLVSSTFIHVSGISRYSLRSPRVECICKVVHKYGCKI